MAGARTAKRTLSKRAAAKGTRPEQLSDLGEEVAALLFSAWNALLAEWPDRSSRPHLEEILRALLAVARENDLKSLAAFRGVARRKLGLPRLDRAAEVRRVLSALQWTAHPFVPRGDRRASDVGPRAYRAAATEVVRALTTFFVAFRPELEILWRRIGTPADLEAMAPKLVDAMTEGLVHLGPDDAPKEDDAEGFGPGTVRAGRALFSAMGYTAAELDSMLSFEKKHRKKLAGNP